MAHRIVLLLALVAAVPAAAQPFGPGPAGTPVGSSMSGMRIGPAGAGLRGSRIPNAEIFGDTVGERAFGRPYDDSYLAPEIRNIGRDEPVELRATEGRSDLNQVNAGAFARGGPAAIGRSSVTRGSAFGGARAVIVPRSGTRSERWK